MSSNAADDNPAPADDPARIRIRRRVEWMDTDAAGIYHWTTVVRYAEAAEAALHTALGIAGETFGFTPRVSVAFEFRRPLAFNDEVLVDLTVESVGRSSVGYALTLTEPEDRLVAEGRITTCLVDRATGSARPWPEAVRTALSAGGAQAGE